LVWLLKCLWPRCDNMCVPVPTKARAYAGCAEFCQALVSPTHKRTEGRAPVRGSEITSKAAALQGGSSRNRCYAERKIVDFCECASYRFLAQLFFVESNLANQQRINPNDLRRGNAHYRAKHSATRLSRQHCRRPTPRSRAAGANGTHIRQWCNALTNSPNSSKVYRREG
jgi:hypothetical protein